MTCHSTRVWREESRVFDLQSAGILREARGECRNGALLGGKKIAPRRSLDGHPRKLLFRIGALDLSMRVALKIGHATRYIVGWSYGGAGCSCKHDRRDRSGPPPPIRH